MKKQQSDIELLGTVLGPALRAAFLQAAELAKQTRTYLVVERNARIEHIPYDEIDAFVAEQQCHRSKTL